MLLFRCIDTDPAGDLLISVYREFCYCPFTDGYQKVYRLEIWDAKRGRMAEVIPFASPLLAGAEVAAWTAGKRWPDLLALEGAR